MEIAGTARKTTAILSNHVRELVGHTLDSSRYNGHGHAEGRQGPKGHDMVDSDAKLQKGEYIPRAAFSGVPQNTQNTYSDGTGSAEASDPSTSDYATVDRD